MRFYNDTIEKYIPFVLSLLFLILYSITLSPTLSFIDSGELAAVCFTLGIAHPTGYPLFTLIGHLFSKFALFGSEIYTLNLMCAIFCAIAIGIFYKCNRLIYYSEKTIDTKREDKKKRNKKMFSGNNFLFFVASLSAAISLGLSRNYWFQSTSIEVYPLHILFLSILLYLFVVSYEQPLFENNSINLSSLKLWLLLAFTLGLSFTNHMSTVFLIPAFAFMYFYKYKFNSRSFKILLIFVVPFLLGLSLYLYLPFRASSSPTINWGDPSSFEKFRWHFSGKQYSIWVFSSIAEMKGQIKYFLSIVPSDYLYLPIITALLGILHLYKNNRKYFYFTGILFLTCFLLAVNYSIVDIDSYFLLAYFVVSIWIGCGIVWLYSLIFEGRPNLKPVYLLLFLIIPLMEIYNYQKTDESKNYLVEDYTMNVFKSVAQGGIVISYQWDNWVSASYYYQHVKGVRKDIVVIDKELCRRSWYLKQLSQNYPWLIEKSKKEVDEFLQDLYKFEHDLPFNAAVIDKKYYSMLNSFIEKNISNTPVYVTNEIEREVGTNYKRIPEGLVYRLNNKIEYLAAPSIDITFRPFNKSGKYPDMLMSFYGIMLVNRASYEYYFGFRDRAQQYLDKLNTIYPNYPPAQILAKEMNTNGKYF